MLFLHSMGMWSDHPRAEPICRELQVISGIPEWAKHVLDPKTSQILLAEKTI